MSDTNQTHHGGGDNVGRDKIANIEKQYVTYESGREISRLLTKFPSLDDKIIGREEAITNLKENLQTSQRVVLMNGMGGIGKTTTAIAYANRYKEEYVHIAWLEQLGDFDTDLATNQLLISNLGLTPSGDAATDTQFILNALANLGGKSLLVIDNGNKQLREYKDYFPKAPGWHVLITSREELSFGEKMALGFLSKEDALKLFYTHYKLDKNDELAHEILLTVDYHTLTIEILAKTAQSLEIASLEKLTSLLKERGIKIGKPVDFSRIAHSKEEQIKHLFPYLEAIFQLPDTITEEEVYLLKQLIGLPPIFHNWEKLTALLQITEENETIWDNLIVARNSLRKKGWLIYDEKQKAYKMHRIIQDVLKEKLKPSYEDLEVLIKSISRLLYFDDTKDNPVDKFQYVIFGERILQIIFHNKSEDFAIFQSNLALVCQDLGDYKNARDLLEQALESDIKNFGEDHPSTAISRSNLALVYQDLGDYENARDLLEQALESDIKNFGEDHPSTAIRRSNLALVYKALGDYENARDLLEQALESDIKNFGEDHPSTAISRSNLALVYQALGDYENARDLLEQALESAIKNFGEDHPSTAISRSNLALVYQALGDYENARDLLEQALESAIKNFGEDHPSTAIRRSNLALVYQDLGDYENARDLLEQALESDIKNFGEDHPSTARSRSNLALVYKALGDYENARDLLEQALESAIKNFGEDHPSTAIRRSNLALVYKALGDYENARDLLEQALESDIKNFGEDHPSTARSRSNLALVYKALGDYENARDLLEQALESDIKNFGEDHPSTARSRSNLALVYKALGDYENARDLLEQALESAIKNFGEDHPSTAIRRSNLALVYKALGDYENARDLLEQALESAIKNSGKTIPPRREAVPIWL